MIVAQVFLEAMEGCHLFLSPFFVMQTAIFRVSPSAVVQVSVSSGCKDGLPLISSAVIGVSSGLGSSVSFHSPQRAGSLQRCSFSSGSQPELLFLAGFTSPFGSCLFSLGSQELFSFLGTFVGPFDSLISLRHVLPGPEIFQQKHPSYQKWSLVPTQLSNLKGGQVKQTAVEARTAYCSCTVVT